MTLINKMNGLIYKLENDDTCEHKSRQSKDVKTP